MRMPFVVFAASLWLLACEDEKVTRYRVPRPSVSTRRILAALITVEGRSWVFKLDGPSDLIEPQRANFVSLLRSARFQGDEATWTLPEGWTADRTAPMRYATIRTGDLELAITQMQAQELLPNINRWRGQLGLGPIGREEISRCTVELALEQTTGTVIDLMAGAGTTTSTSSSPSSSAASAQKRPIEYSVPADWKQIEPGPMALAAFAAGEIKITVSRLGGDGGGLGGNIERWAAQIGLTPAPETRSVAREIEFGGASGTLVDLAGPKGCMRVAIASHGGQSWFFKMMGPAEQIEKVRDSFDAFLKSVAFRE